MEDINLENIWKAYDQKIEEARILNLQSWVVNMQTFEYVQTHKAKTILHSLGRFKMAAIFIGVLWVAFLGLLVYGNAWKNMYFSCSLLLLMLFSILAIVVYIKQIVLIREINYSESIIVTQQKLEELQFSTIRFVRILWLQMPFYTTWFWNSDWIMHDTLNFVLIQLPVTFFFVFLSIWLYRNITVKNADKKWWLRILLGNKEWGSVVKAMSYLLEIEEFKKG
jgi:hypothetical protein